MGSKAGFRVPDFDENTLPVAETLKAPSPGGQFVESDPGFSEPSLHITLHF
jgi:hypothetical protein